MALKIVYNTIKIRHMIEKCWIVDCGNRLYHIGNMLSKLVGKWIMEIKATKAVPLWFAGLLSKYEIYPMSYSKYGTEFLGSLET